MNFKDFAADTDNTVVLELSAPDSEGTVQFRISSQILGDHLAVGNQVHTDKNV